MKNSLFKRAVAAVATVPLALTQCLTYSSFAASTNTVKAASNAVKADNEVKSLSLDSLFYIAPDDVDQISNWNTSVASALTQLVAEGNTTGSFDVTKLVEKAVANAGKYSDHAEEAATKIESVTYEIAENNDITVTAKIGNLAEVFVGKDAASFGKRLAEIAEENNSAAICDIDLSNVNISGEIKVVIKASELDLGNKVTIDASFTSAEGKTYTAYEVLSDYIPAKAAELQKSADAQIDAIDGIDHAAVKAKVANLIKYYVTIINEKAEKANVVFTADKSAKDTTVEAMIQSAVNYVNKNFNKNISASSATEFLNKSAVADSYNDVLAQLNNAAAPYSVDITADDLGAFIDSLTNIDYSVAGGVASISGQFADAEQAAVKAYVENNGFEFVDSYKEFTGVVDFNGAKKEDGSSVSVEVKRILVTDTTTTTTTTTSNTTSPTTSSTTSTDTTTSTTSTDTTTSTTSTDTTTSTTSTDTTTSTTSTDTTTSTTSTDTTTSSTTTSTTTTTTLTQVANGYYVTVNETKPAFYLSTENSFDASQVSDAELHISYVEGYTDENGEFVVVNELPEVTQNITEFIGFDTATPANTYDYENNKTFKYEIALSYDGSAIAGGPDAGELIKDKDGNVITVTAYIGLKGDVDFDNTVSAMDASAVLTYYVGGSDVISFSELVKDDAIYEEFAAFLADVTEPAAEKRFAAKADRTINAIDASAILTYYVSKTDEVEEEELWKSLGC